MVPILGPKTLRHFSGDLINYSSNNILLSDEVNKVNNYERPLDAINKRSNLTNFFEDVNSSNDPYVKMRSIYIQNRRKNLFSDQEYEKKLLKQEEEEFEKLLQ